MPLLLFAAASFACLNPSHHDGDNIRCANIAGAMRLSGIDAPEMPGACRPGRACTPGDPIAARDYLRSLTRGRDIVCEQVDTDNYDRRIVECRADGASIGCAMVASGHAVERYGNPDCSSGNGADTAETAANWPGGEPPRAGRVDPPAPPRPERPQPLPRVPEEPLRLPALGDTRADLADAKAAVGENISLLPPRGFWLVWLAVSTIIGFAMMAVDKQRALEAVRRRVRRVPEARLLMVAAIGGSGGVLLAQQLLHHKIQKQPFARNLLLVIGAQIGILAGMVLLRF